MLVHNKNHCFRTRSGIKDKIKQQNKLLTTCCNLRKKTRISFVSNSLNHIKIRGDEKKFYLFY